MGGDSDHSVNFTMRRNTALLAVLATVWVGLCESRQCYNNILSSEEADGDDIAVETCDDGIDLCLTYKDVEDGRLEYSCAMDSDKEVGCKNQQRYCDTDLCHTDYLCNSSTMFSSVLSFTLLFMGAVAVL